MMRWALSSTIGAARAFVLAFLPFGSAAAAADAVVREPIDIVIDRAKVMRISRPADTIIIGNPAIADATIQDNRTLIITGRSYGSTNLIVLDAAGQPIADEVLMVRATDDAVVTVFRRSSQVTLSCTPECSPTLTIGDNGEAFASVDSQIKAHNSLSEGTAGQPTGD